MKYLSFILCLFLLMTASLSAGAVEDLQERFDRANASFNEGQYDRAIQDYNAVLSQYPDFMEAYFNRGMAY